MTTYRERHLAGHYDPNAQPDASWTDAAKKQADKNGINIHDVTGTGKNGQITVADVQGFMMQQDTE